jgi:hypothetical protein
MNAVLITILGWIAFFFLCWVLSKGKKSITEKPLSDEAQQFVDQIERELNLVYSFAEYMGDDKAGSKIKSDLSGLPDSYQNIEKAFITFFEVFLFLGKKGTDEWNLAVGCAKCLPCYDPNFILDEQTSATVSITKQVGLGQKTEDWAEMIIEMAKLRQGDALVEKLLAEAENRVNCKTTRTLLLGLIPRVPLIKHKFYSPSAMKLSPESP